MNLNQRRSRMNRHQRRETANVAFFSTMANHQTHLGVNQNVIFDNVVTNHGNGYSNHAGDFRAPVDGTYVFSVTLVDLSVNDAHFAIVKGTTDVGNLYLRGQGMPLTTTSTTVVLDLAQGEDVFIKNKNLDQSLFGNYYCSFSGFLLTQKFGPNVVG